MLGESFVTSATTIQPIVTKRRQDTAKPELEPMISFVGGFLHRRFNLALHLWPTQFVHAEFKQVTVHRRAEHLHKLSCKRGALGWMRENMS